MNISFALTTPLVVYSFATGEVIKDVTRRLGWLRLRPGQRLKAVLKGQGIPKGGKVEVLGEIEVVSVRREALWHITGDLKYGFEEVKREGFEHHATLCWPTEWVDWFCRGRKRYNGHTHITRIEYRYSGAFANNEMRRVYEPGKCPPDVLAQSREELEASLVTKGWRVDSLFASES